MSERERKRTESQVWGIASSKVRRHERVKALNEQWSPECTEWGCYSGVFFTYLVGHLQLWDFSLWSAWHLWLHWLKQWWFTSVHCPSSSPQELQLSLTSAPESLISTLNSSSPKQCSTPVSGSFILPMQSNTCLHQSLRTGQMLKNQPSWTLSPAQISNLPNSINSL